MEIVAHRGFGGKYPENTRRAFTEAAKSADWIEFDLRSCATGELVVFHDETLDRVTDASGPIAAKPWEELQTVEVNDSGEAILTLEQALKAIPAETNVQLELKEYGLAEDVLAVTSEFPHTVRFISFSTLILNEIRMLAPEADLGYIIHPGLFGENVELALEMAAHLGCSAVHVYPQMLTSTAVLELASARGLAVQLGGQDGGVTQETVAEYEQQGIDALSLDDPVQTEPAE